MLATHANNAAVEEGRAIPLVRVRLDSVDVLRGVIMILMTLDHTRDFLGVTGVNPTDPTQTTIPLFFPRWITQFCAPSARNLTSVTGAPQYFGPNDASAHSDPANFSKRA